MQTFILWILRIKHSLNVCKSFQSFSTVYSVQFYGYVYICTHKNSVTVKGLEYTNYLKRNILQYLNFSCQVIHQLKRNKM